MEGSVRKRLRRSAARLDATKRPELKKRPGFGPASNTV
jgi:hypothetical protein